MSAEVTDGDGHRHENELIESEAFPISLSVTDISECQDMPKVSASAPGNPHWLTCLNRSEVMRLSFRMALLFPLPSFLPNRQDSQGACWFCTATVGPTELDPGLKSRSAFS